MKTKRLGVRLGIVCALALMCYSVVAMGQSGINVVINSKAVQFTQSSGYPFIDENGRTLVPLRVTMEAAGTSVGWDQANQTAIVITAHDRIEVPVGADYLYNNNQKIQNDSAAVVREGRVYLPIRAVLESAEFTMEWDAKTKTVSAYTFKVDENEFVPYSTGSLSTLVDKVLSGKVVYANGQYYATPEYIKSLTTAKVTYTGSDLNTAVYPHESRYSMADMEIKSVQKEWVSESDLGAEAVTFSSYPVKGFYGGSLGMERHRMPSLPDDFTENPRKGTFNGIRIKVENGTILFNQDDLLENDVLDEPINDMVAVAG